jgi:hypothetical protein
VGTAAAGGRGGRGGADLGGGLPAPGPIGGGGHPMSHGGERAPRAGPLRGPRRAATGLCV